MLVVATGSASAKTPEQLLFQIDHHYGVSTSDARLRPYKVAMNWLAYNCTDRRMRLADYTANTWQIIRKQTDESPTTLRIMQGVGRAFPRNWKRQRCADVFGSYSLLVKAGYSP